LVERILKISLHLKLSSTALPYLTLPYLTLPYLQDERLPNSPLSAEVVLKFDPVHIPNVTNSHQLTTYRQLPVQQ